MAHELDKLDLFVTVPVGTSYRVLVQHQDPSQLNKALRAYGVVLDHDGIIPKFQYGSWRLLMQRAGISKKYWKDPDLLMAEQQILEL